MSTLVLGTPLLAGGPPGWLVYGALGALSVGAGYAALSSAHSGYNAAMANRKLIERTISRTCTQCRDCKDLENDMVRTKNKIQQKRYEALEDKYGMYESRPYPPPRSAGWNDALQGKWPGSTWPGHKTQIDELQDRLQEELKDNSTAGCPPADKSIWEWAHKKAPDKPSRYGGS